MSSRFKWFAIVCSLAVALVVAYFMPSIGFANKGVNVQAQINNEKMVLEQKVIDVSPLAHRITKIYNGNELIGVISNQEKINSLLEKTYSERYQTAFPNTVMNLGTDVYITEEASYFVYENIDDKIMEYIDSKELYSL
jgi:hypothetical protein